MKKLLLGLFLVFLMSASAYAMYGVLQGQDNNGMNTVCYYSNGQVITVGPGEICPVSID